jgi:transcriptional regulator with XRE-family HTH domain
MVYPNIRALREDRDLRQREIAEVLCVSQNTYSQYENGVIEFTAEKLIRLADYYNVSVDYLLGRTDDAQPWKE